MTYAIQRPWEASRQVAAKAGTIEINSELCKGCLLCVKVCPKDLIDVSSRLNTKGYFPAVFKEKGMKTGRRQCTGCCLCAVCCPEMAIEVFRE